MRQPSFGLSAAGYRLEGGSNGPGEPANQWAVWELAGKVPPAQAPGTLWADPEGVLDLAAAAGAESLALSVEWARVEPRPDRPDDDAVERYASIFRSASARGITPVAVLHDLAHPAWLGEELWLTPGSPDRFVGHAARLVAQLSSSCRHWVTLRQPNLVALAGWVDGRHPPRRLGALSDAWAVVDNLLSAHLLAYAAIHDAQPGAEVLLGLRVSSSYDWSRLMVDLLCAPGLGVGREDLDEWVAERRAAHDRAAGPADLGDLAWRRLAAATAPYGSGIFGRRSPSRAVQLAYGSTPEPAGSNGSAPRGHPSYPLDALFLGAVPPHADAVLPGPRGFRRSRRAAPPWEARPDAEALAACCREQARAVPGLPIWVEDGFATHRGAPRGDGWDRASYVRSQRHALGGVGAVARYLYYAPCGGGDPTWPGAEFGFGDAVPRGAATPPR